MPARLIVTRGPETGSQFPLRKRIVTIGRDDGCAIHLDREGVSRNHAQLSLEQGAWSITDLKSRNGTLVNGSRIVEHALTSGDVIGIHDIRLRFEVSDAPPPKAAAGPRELGREDVELVERLRKGREAILGEVRKVIVGQERSSSS
jgi:pSer/pThr/pTyr-binding forkhead associated (FHA) protein